MSSITWIDSQEITFRDLIAVLMIIGCIIAKCFGADGTISVVLAAISAYYFGRRGDVKSRQSNQLRQKKKKKKASEMPKKKVSHRPSNSIPAQSQRKNDEHHQARAQSQQEEAE